MAEPVVDGRTWGELVDDINAGIASERETYGDRHGLVGLFAKKVGPVAVLFYDAGDPRLSLAVVAAAWVLRLTGDANETGLDDLAQSKVEELEREITLPGLVVPAGGVVRYERFPYHGVEAIRYVHPNARPFGPRAKRPLLHHLIDVAATPDLEARRGKYLDRRLLEGAFEARG